MPSHSTISVYNYLSTSKTSISWWSSYDKSPSRVDMNPYLVVPQTSANRFNDFFNYSPFNLLVIYFRRMLGRNYDGFDSLWLSIFIFNCYLRLSIGSSPRKLFLLPCFC